MSKLTKSDLTGVFVVSLMFLGIFFANGSANSAEETDQNKQLQQRVTELEKRIEQLEAQLSGIPSDPVTVVPHAVAPQGLTPLPQAQLAPRAPQTYLAPAAPSQQPNLRVPQDWQKKEINGIQYFVVPLNTTE